MMNSGNSGGGSTQSDGEQEFIDSNYSRGEESISSFFNPSSNFGSNTHQFLTHQINTTFFDPQSNDNGDVFWSGGLRSENGDFSTASSALLSTGNQFEPPPPPPNPDGRASKAPLSSDHFSGVMKNPKKRSRVSHRAPTTVLTTDATNFRQMVQQFTGIPATPFSGSPDCSRRLDLFSAAAALQPGSQYMDTIGGPFYPLNPSLSSSSPLLNPAMIDSVVPTADIVSTTTATATSDAGASTSNNNSSNYPSSLPSDHRHFNIQNQRIVKDNDNLQKQ